MYKKEKIKKNKKEAKQCTYFMDVDVIKIIDKGSQETNLTKTQFVEESVKTYMALQKII